MTGPKISRRAAVATISGGILSACASAPATVLAFEDDFGGPEGSPPDPARWRHDVGNKGYGYRQLQTYTTSRVNSFLDGKGHLVIRATRDRDGYASARLTTFGRFTQYQGTFEARIKLAVQQGVWPAFWLLGLAEPRRSRHRRKLRPGLRPVVGAYPRRRRQRVHRIRKHPRR
jgi:beta-glucanase (GH16 family)